MGLQYLVYFWSGSLEDAVCLGLLFGAVELRVCVSSSILRSGAAVSVISSGSEEREFEPHSGSDKVSLFPSSVYHHYGDSYDGGSYQSIGLTA